MPLLSHEPAFASAADLTACRELLADGSRSFYAASFFLPRQLRDSATALYAFCRLTDDAIDLETGDRRAAMDRLYDRLDRAYAGDPLPIPADRAFAGAVAYYGVPRELPEALLEGFEWDAQGRIYEDLSGVYDYSARVAAAVGAMMAALMGVRDPNVLARACDLGTAMQISNICRDVGEDARNGRIYLPLEWLREAGLDPDAWLENPVFNDAIGETVERMLDFAEVLYQRAEAGIARLPVGARPGIYAARLLYAEIGKEVARNGYDSVSQRAVVSRQRKLTLLGRAMAVTPMPLSRPGNAPPLPENRFLVEAAAAAPSFDELHPLPVRKRKLEDKVNFVFDLFEAMDERKREAHRYIPASEQPALGTVSG
jgi:phytoene synthase